MGFVMFREIMIVLGIMLSGWLGLQYDYPNQKADDISVLNGPYGNQYVFIENIGQWDPTILFIGRTHYGYVGFTYASVIHYMMNGSPGTEGAKIDVVDIPFDGGRPATLMGYYPKPGEHNYLLGSDPGRWHTGARSFEKVVYRDIWDGVDLSYFYSDLSLKYEFEVGPGADPSKISLKVNGAKASSNGKSVIMKTANGCLTDGGLICFEKETGKEVRSSFDVAGNTIRFDIGEYDRSGSLVIDPIIYSTFLGGSANDHGGMGIAVDADGSTYVCGYTGSLNFPTTSGSYDTSHNGGEDAYVTKLDPSGKYLVYSTYIGGSNADRGWKLRLDENNSVILTGWTKSQDFPTTEGAYDRTLNNNIDKWDVFILKLNSTGDDLIFSTFIGGSSDDVPEDMAIDPWGRIVITGYTSSSDYPIVNSDLQSQNNGDFDILITCLEKDGSTLSYSLVYGGKAKDQAIRIALDHVGNVLVTGQTQSDDLTTTVNAIERSYQGGGDGFVIYFGDNCTDLLYSSYIGGSYFDTVRGVDIDMEGNIYISGRTESSDLPKIGVQHKVGIDTIDAFVMCIDQARTTPIFSTRFGGNGDDGSNYLALDDEGNIMILGNTYSEDVPYTENAEGQCGDEDGFFALFSKDGGKLLYSIRFGGTVRDFPLYMAPTHTGEVRISGLTGSSDFPMRGDSYDTSNAMGPYDAFIITLEYWKMPDAPSGIMASSGDGWVQLEWDPPSLFELSGSLGYEIYKGKNTNRMYLYNITDESVHLDLNVTNGITYHYKVCAYNIYGKGKFSDIVSARPVAPPGIPVNCTISDGDRWVNISWKHPIKDGGDPVIGYRIYRRTNFSTPHTLFKTAYEKNLNDTDVKNGVDYGYLISAFNDNGEGNLSDEVIGSPSKTPSEPMELNVKNGDAYVNLSWSPPLSDGGSPLLYYEVLRGPGPDSLKRLNTTDGTTYFLDTEVQNGQEYHYAVRAFNRRGASPVSEIVKASPAREPDAPFGLIATAGDRRVSLEWYATGSNGGRSLINFTIYRRTEDDWTYLGMVEPHESEYLDSDVVNGVTYQYIVTAWNSVGESMASNIASAKPITHPGKPIHFTASGGDRRIVLTWLTPSSDGGSPILGYMLHRGESPTTLALLTQMGPEDLNHTDEGLINGRTYYYLLFCRNDRGESPSSDLAFAIPATVPQPPSSISARAGDAYVEISWEPSPDNGGFSITRTLIYRGIGDNAMERIAELDMLSGTYNDRNVENGIEYHYRLACVNSIGVGPMSEPVLAMPSTTPGTPLNLTCSVEGGKVHIAWDPPPDDGGSPVTGYHIYRSSGAGPRIKLAMVNDTRYLDGSVYTGILYIYSVNAVNSNGEGGRSNEVEIMIEKEVSFLPLIIAGILASLLIIAALIATAVFITKKRKKESFVAGPPITAFPVMDQALPEAPLIISGPVEQGSDISGPIPPPTNDVPETSEEVSEPVQEEGNPDIKREGIDPVLEKGDPQIIQRD